MTSTLLRRVEASVLLAALSWALLGADVAASQPATPISPAEQAVFLDPHLQSLKLPVQLRYDFQRAGTDPFRDDVSVAVSARPGGGCCSTEGRFLSGGRAMALPDLPDAQANPVTLFFLEREVRELQRATGGQAAHFRRRIRLALAESALVSATTIRYGGRELPATQVRITPYRDDPVRGRFERFALTQYQFVLCPQVPGGVYSLRTTVPAPAGDSPPLAEETLTLQPVPAP